jgi:hypothetical protein
MLGLKCAACGRLSPVLPKTASTQKISEWIIAHIATEGRSSTSSTATATESKATEAPIGPTPSSKEQTLNLERLREKLKELEPPAVGPPKDLEDEFFEKLRSDCAGTASDDEIFNCIADFATEWNLANVNRLNVLCLAILANDPRELLNLLVKRRTLLIRMAMDESCQHQLLGLIANDICNARRELMNSGPIIWYTLFQNEIVEESVMKEWKDGLNSKVERNRTRAKELRTLLEPFYKWLKEAEVEKGDDSGDEKDHGKEEEDGEDSEEEDIDAI